MTASLVSNLMSLDGLGRPLRVATGCSGTDTPVLVLKKLFARWSDRFDFTLAIDHLWSCDNNAEAREFILHHFTPRYMFEDVVTLGRQVAWDMRSGKNVVVPSPDLLAFSSECDGYSPLNRTSGGGSQIGTDSGSGTTLAAFVDIVAFHKPKVTTPIMSLPSRCDAPPASCPPALTMSMLSPPCCHSN
jgi:hypothetical protein